MTETYPVTAADIAAARNAHGWVGSELAERFAKHRIIALEQAAGVADASAARLRPHEVSNENSRSLQTGSKMARAECEAISRNILALRSPEKSNG